MKQLIRKWLGINEFASETASATHRLNSHSTRISELEIKVVRLESDNKMLWNWVHKDLLKIENLESNLQTQNAINNMLINDIVELNDRLDITIKCMLDLNELVGELNEKSEINSTFDSLMNEIDNYKAQSNGTKKATKKAKKKAK